MAATRGRRSSTSRPPSCTRSISTTSSRTVAVRRVSRTTATIRVPAEQPAGHAARRADTRATGRPSVAARPGPPCRSPVTPRSCIRTAKGRFGRYNRGAPARRSSTTSASQNLYGTEPGQPRTTASSASFRSRCLRTIRTPSTTARSSCTSTTDEGVTWEQISPRPHRVPPGAPDGVGVADHS